MLFVGSAVGLAGLIVGFLIAWFLNAILWPRLIVPGTLAMVFAAVAGIGIAIAGIYRLRDEIVVDTVTAILFFGVVSGAAVPVFLGQIARLRFMERLAAGNNTSNQSNGKFFCGVFLLFVALGPGSRPQKEDLPRKSREELIAQMGAEFAVWWIVTGGALWLIRNGTKPQKPFYLVDSAGESGDSPSPRYPDRPVL